MNEPLSTQDINTLIEALDAWEDKDAAGVLVEAILDKTIGRGMPSLPTEIRDARKQRESEKVVRKERSIMLKAKLLRLRDAQSADALIAEGKVNP